MIVLGLIPARGGSKGVPGKNLRPINGKSLVVRAASAGVTSGVLDRLILSTDSPQVADLARNAGVEVPFMRPADLATDETPMIKVVHHALDDLARAGYMPDAVLLLQPTAPLRTPEHLRTAVQLIDGNDAVCSVVPLPQELSPHFVMRITDGYLRHFLPDGAMYTRRQDVPRAYRRDGTVYLTRTTTLRDGSFYGERCVPMILEPQESVTIDTLPDWSIAEARLEGIEGSSTVAGA